MLNYQLQREDYWIKTVHSYGLNKRTKIMNKDSSQGKLSHHFQDIANALLTLEHSPKYLITFFHLALKYY